MKWTPLHTRIISHRIGDGTVNFYKRPVWDNKRPEGFLSLCKSLKINLWKPTTSDSYGTQKIVIPISLYKEFAKLNKKDFRKLVEDREYLLETILTLPFEHRLQAMLSLIFDDGSCRSWMLVAFEDQDLKVAKLAQELWESLFPFTSRLDYHTTKNGTKIYHLYVNRNGIIQLYEEIQKLKTKYGNLSGLWQKEKDLHKRYIKATSENAKRLEETRKNEEKWKENLLEFSKLNGYVTIPIAKRFLNLSTDRAYRVLSILKKDKKLKVKFEGNKSRFLPTN